MEPSSEGRDSVGVQAKTPAAGNKGSGTAQGGNPDAESAKMMSPSLGDNKEFGSDKSCCPACLIPLKYVGNNRVARERHIWSCEGYQLDGMFDPICLNRSECCNNDILHWATNVHQ